MLQKPVFLGACWSRSTSSQTHLFPHCWATPCPFLLSGAPETLRPWLWRATANPSAWPWPSGLISPGSPLLSHPFSLLALQPPPHPTYRLGCFPPPCLCSGHSLGLELPSHLSTSQFHHPSWPRTGPTSQQPALSAPPHAGLSSPLCGPSTARCLSLYGDRHLHAQPHTNTHAGGAGGGGPGPQDDG